MTPVGSCWFLLIKTLLIKNNKKRGGGSKNEAGGDEKHVVFFFTWPKNRNQVSGRHGSRGCTMSASLICKSAS